MYLALASSNASFSRWAASNSVGRVDGPVVAASYEGGRSHPVVLARELWDAVPDEGARVLEPVLVDCSDLEPPGDVDYSS